MKKRQRLGMYSGWMNDIDINEDAWEAWVNYAAFNYITGKYKEEQAKKKEKNNLQ